MTTPEAPGPRDPERVSAETGRILTADVTESPLEPMARLGREEVMTRSMGALVVFDGVVRDHDGGRDVSALAYSAHPSAAEAMAETARTVLAEHPGVRLWAVHRVGAVPIGESALTVMAAAAHRGEAFAACEAMTDAVKVRVPIWKEQTLGDGSAEWVGL